MSLLHKLSPFKALKIWGGTNLSALKGMESSEKIGEYLEVSRLQNQSSICDGKALFDLSTEKQIPYCVKFIETTDNLSIQVHPDDQYALLNENSMGKEECWVILDAKPGAGIFLGLKSGVTKEIFEKALTEKKSMNELLNFYPVRKGDFFFVPAGTIHAIGTGITLIEFQQSSGITYRVWDWDRLDDQGNSRELHIKESLEVINFEEELNTAENFRVKNIFFEGSEWQEVFSHRDFHVESGALETGKTLSFSGSEGGRFLSIVNLDGSLELKYGEETLKLDPYTSAVVLDNRLNINVSATTASRFFVIK